MGVAPSRWLCRLRWCAVAAGLALVLMLARAAAGQDAAGLDAAHAHAQAASAPTGFFTDLFKVYVPRQVCMFHEPAVIWLHAISDALIAAAYFTIPFVLVRIVRVRRDVAFGWAIWMFAAFILGCGLTHLIGVVDLWYPLYRVDGLVKLFTGLVSVATAVAIWPLVGRVATFRSTEQLQAMVEERTAELARAHEQLRQRTALFQAISDTSGDVIFAKDRQGRLTFANPATLAVIGKPLEQALGTTDAEYLDDKAAAARVMANDRRIMESGVAEVVEEPVPMPDGARRMWLSSKVPYRDERGEVVGLLGIARDITERELAEAALRESKERYHTLFDSIRDGYSIVEMIFDEAGEPADYRFLEVNQAFVAETGLQDAVGRRVLELVPDLERHWIDTYGRVALTGEPEQFENHVAAWDRWFEVHAFRFGPAERRQVAIFFRNITERKRTERELAATRERLQSALAAGDVATWVWDLVNDRVWADRNLTTFFNVSEAEAQGGPVETYLRAIVDEDRERVAGEIRGMLEGTGSHFQAEYCVRGADGVRRWVMARGTIERDAQGRAVRLPGVVLDVTERKRAEQALRQSEARLSAVLDALPVSVIIADQGGQVLRMNPASDKIWGPAPMSGSVEGYREWAGFWPDSGQRLEPHEWPMSRAVLHGESPTGVRVEIERFDDRGRRLLELSAAPVRGERGERLGGVVACMDVTERVRAERSVRESEAMLSAVLDALPVGVIIASPDGRLLRDNAAHRELWGVPPETTSWEQYGEWVGYWPKTHERIQAQEWAMSRALLKGEVVRNELVECERFGTGERRFFLNNAAPVRDVNGKIVGGVVAELDVTERLATEVALRENEQRLRLAAEAAGIGFWTWDLERNVSVLDETCAAFFGVRAGVPLPIGEIVGAIHPDDRAHVEAAASRAIMSTDRYELAFRVLRPDGSVQWIAGLGNAVREEGRSVRLAGVNWDITAQKLAEIEREQLLESERAARSEAERASRLKDEFLATVSHELRTPLNAMYGWSQILLRGNVAGAALHEGLSAIERNARAQKQLIEDLLDMSRIVSGKIRLDLQAVDLQDVVRAALATVQPSAAAKGIRLETPPDTIIAPLRGDPTRLQQVVWNLLSNAIKFTPAGGQVQVSLQHVEGHVRLSVTDTGQGIKPEFLPFVFDRFRQADGSITRQHGGLGLGLAIVKQLVELHGGSVRVASPGEGRGATFTVQLPSPVPAGLEAPAAIAAPASGAPAAAPTDYDKLCNVLSLAQLTVLAVDDEPDALTLVQRVLEECDARVLTASSAREALDVLERETPDVMLCDIGMPEVDGYEFIRRVRAAKTRAANVPAIALTAFARAEDRTRALIAGFQMHLAKPVQPTELVAAVGAVAGLAGGGAGKGR